MSTQTEALSLLAERCEALCAELRKAVEALGLGPEVSSRLLADITPQGLQLIWQRDPANASQNLTGQWLHKGRPRGSLQLLHDGNGYAEFDVLEPHPSRPRWFIEAVTVWGHEGALCSEPRLLPMPGDDT